MKKWFNIAVLALMVSFAACTKVDTVPEVKEKISFSVGSYTANRTKATTSVLTEFQSFSSKAYLYADGYESETQEIFGTDGETITPDNTSSPTYWAPSRDYYWPKSSDSYINFVSWYDKNGAPSTVSQTALAWTSRTIVADDNILFADVAWRQNANQNTYYTEGVPTLFHHALSRVKINLSASPLTDTEDANTTYAVTIQSMKLKAVFNAGTMSLTNSDPGTKTTKAWTPATATYYWSPVSSSSADLDIVTSDTDVTATPTAVLAERSFMPQSLTANMILEIVYSVEVTSAGSVIIEETDIPASVKLNVIKNSSDVAITQWLPNTKYTYNIIINPQTREILLNPTVETEWTDGTSYSATVE